MTRGINDSSNSDDLTSPLAGFSFRGEHLWLDDIQISSWDCPSCLLDGDGDCHVCEFFSPEECRLLRDSAMRDDLRMLFAIYREEREELAARWEEKAILHERLVGAIQSELVAHGRPLHYSVIARMIADRHTALDVTETTIVRTLARHPELFDRVEEGVYEARSGVSPR